MNDINKYIKLIEDQETLQSIVDFFNKQENEKYETIEEIVDDLELSQVVEDLVDDNKKAEVLQVLDELNKTWEIHIFPNETKILVVEDELVVFNDIVYTDLDVVIYDIPDEDVLDLYEYDPKEWSKEFWDGVKSRFIVYHATTEERWEDIQEEGLEARSETRGLSNRGTSDAVFTTTSEDELALGTYGDVHLAIDLAKMKADGYTPRVSEEQPWIVDQYRSAIAHMLETDYEGSTSDGISPDTLIIFGHIPKEYIERVD